jgi:hypothetical protein
MFADTKPVLQVLVFSHLFRIDFILVCHSVFNFSIKSDFKWHDNLLMGRVSGLLTESKKF